MTADRWRDACLQEGCPCCARAKRLVDLVADAKGAESVDSARRHHVWQLFWQTAAGWSDALLLRLQGGK